MNLAFSTAWPVLWAQQATQTAWLDEPMLLGISRQWVIWIAWLALGFFGLFPGIVAYMVWAERKVAARFQDRIGPNRVGPLGLLQPIADAIKLITKENIVPGSADKVVHLLAPVLLLVSAFLTLAVIPFGFGGKVGNRLTGLTPIDLPSGLLYLIAVSSMSSLGIFLAGWASRNKYSLLGAMRAVAQLVSYEVPQVLATVPIILWTGSLSLVAILNHQVEFGWFIFSPPGFMAFVLLTIANIAEVNRTPFDLPEAESEIIAGYHTEYSGMRFGLFFLAEYLSVFSVSCLGTILFLGGGSLPLFDLRDLLSDNTTSFVFVNAITVGVFSVKVILYVFLMFWIRATLPRMRVDQLMAFAWKMMVPLSIINILIAAIWQEVVVGHNLNYIPVFGDTFRGWLVTVPLEIVAVFLVFWIHRVTREDSAPALASARRPAASLVR
ncbi:MAG: NADH:ubiquinone oxidoreductase subunit 1 [Planctomycetota bacterium]|nr:NADH:ubiquinone oxidoreductase subunit 1 [Planctomycetota bacterium]